MNKRVEEKATGKEPQQECELFTLEELQAIYQAIDIDHIDISIMDKLWDMIESYEET